MQDSLERRLTANHEAWLRPHYQITASSPPATMSSSHPRWIAVAHVPDASTR